MLICPQDCFHAVPLLGLCPPSPWQRTCIRTSWSPGGARRAGSQAHPLFAFGALLHASRGPASSSGVCAGGRPAGLCSQTAGLSSLPETTWQSDDQVIPARPAQLWFCQSGPLKSRLMSCRNSPVWSVFTEAGPFASSVHSF